MIGQHIAVIHLIDVVAGQHQHILGIVALDKVDVLIDGVGGTLIPIGALIALIGGQDVNAGVHTVQIPRLTGADVVVQLQRLILSEHAHRLDAGIDTVGQGEVDDAVLTAVGYCRFGNLAGQRVQTAALAASQQHGDTFLLTKHGCFPPQFLLAALALVLAAAFFLG